MHSCNPRVAILLLLGLAWVLAVGNLFTLALRSTWPRALNATVLEKKLLHEKLAGVDDVRLLKLDNGSTIQVEEEVYRLVGIGDSIYKVGFSRRLLVLPQDGDTNRREIPPSKDWIGMRWCMLIFIAIASALVFLTQKQSTETPTNV